MRRLRLFFTQHKSLWLVACVLVGALVWAVTLEIDLRRLEAFPFPSEKAQPWEEFRPHPTLFWQMRPNLKTSMIFRAFAGDDPAPSDTKRFEVTTNSWGLRCPELKKTKSDRQWRVMCLGDEITFGYGVNDNQTYESFLQRHMREARKNQQLQVINAGCPGWSSYQAREWTRMEGRYFEPEFYVLGFGFADSAAEDMSDRDRVSSILPLVWLQFLLNHSELYHYWQRLDAEKYNPYGLPPVGYQRKALRVPKEQFSENLTWFADTAKEDGAKVIFLNLPAPTLYEAEIVTEYRAVIQQVAQDSGSGYVDLQRVIHPHSSENMFNGNYISAKGNDLISMAIMVELQKMGVPRS